MAFAAVYTSETTDQPASISAYDSTATTTINCLASSYRGRKDGESHRVKTSCVLSLSQTPKGKQSKRGRKTWRTCGLRIIQYSRVRIVLYCILRCLLLRFSLQGDCWHHRAVAEILRQTPNYVRGAKEETEEAIAFGSRQSGQSKRQTWAGSM